MSDPELDIRMGFSKIEIQIRIRSIYTQIEGKKTRIDTNNCSNISNGRNLGAVEGEKTDRGVT